MAADKRIVDAMYAADVAGGMAALMFQHEIASGARRLVPADGVQIDAGDWYGEPVITRRGGDVRIIAIWSARPGAFGRLVRSILKSGLCPVVVEPMGDRMPAILKKWRWVASAVPSGLAPDDTAMEWRPTAQPRPDRSRERMRRLRQMGVAAPAVTA